MYVGPVNMTVRGVWSVIKNLLPENLARKVVLMKEDPMAYVQDTITPLQEFNAITTI
eukprot:gene21858-26312_t